ncbi:sigma-54 dependent transcriptional regulator/response regulator [hydrothermal vent metagenome]|uniref:Sigma-54 dependent transcriptional regulator/response regulator n=1 Tax=hydrothermal vent metagenome TaxID=652676 RepID=A0A3B0USJ5_9ZZZZ
MPSILIVDDEKSIRFALREILEDENYEVDEAADGVEALKKLSSNVYDAVLSDIKMPKMDGITLLEKAIEEGIDTPFIMISAHGTIDTAVDATKKGAFDFIEKPPDLNRVLLAARNAVEKETLVKETKVLKKKIAKSTSIIGESAPIQKVFETIEKVAPSEARVLITGPNGSGKELIAKSLHKNSGRSKNPLIEVNCAAIPSELIESELFGHEKGAFTSAIKQRIGKFEQAHNGTLFLDEIGDMSLSAQAKVLRALQENVITRVGGDKEIKVNVRVFAATNKNLKEEISKGNFREDLYHRLSVIIINVPDLNNRKDDIPLLVNHFLQLIANEYGAPAKIMNDEAIKLLQAHNWTGNIRELRNVVERLVILGGKDISAKDVTQFGHIG